MGNLKSRLSWHAAVRASVAHSKDHKHLLIAHCVPGTQEKDGGK